MEEKEIFITEILVKECRGIKDFKIPLSPNKRKHLIITGKNGSGKTSLLNDFNNILLKVYEGKFSEIYKKIGEFVKANPSEDLYNSSIWKEFNEERRKLTTEIEKSNITAFFENNNSVWETIQDGDFITIFFPAQRKLKVTSAKGGTAINLPNKSSSIERLNDTFLQYMVNLKIEQLFAGQEGDTKTVEEIEKWFSRFQDSLRDIFNNSELELQFDRKKYNFWLIEKDKEPFDLNTLSDGYAAVLDIVSELIIRMEAHKKNAYDMQGVVLIDEIENHLHVDLQKKILPFLTAFFPKIQFIVTTHSPFVISSVEDAVVCDLEHRIVVQDLSNYSYDALLESYFGVDKYSSVLKEKVVEYETLSNKKNPSVEEKYYIKELRAYLDAAPVFLSKELKAKLQQIDLQNLNNK